MEKQSQNTRLMGGLPSEWRASRFELEHQQSMISAFHLPTSAERFWIFTFELHESSRSESEKILKAMVKSFRQHAPGAWPWVFYDVEFSLDSRFRPVHYQFISGRKELGFEWRSRRFKIWHHSLAEIILKDANLTDWAVQFLNRTGVCPAVRFESREKDGIRARRRWKHPMGHVEEWRRICFRYCAGVQHLEDKNQIVLWVMQYRKKEDLEMMNAFKAGDGPCLKI